MIILLLILMFISAVVFTAIERTKSPYTIIGMFIGIILMITGFMLYYTKSCGISKEVQIIFFLDTRVQRALQYSIISLDTISRFISIGRSVFIFFAFVFSVNISEYLPKKLRIPLYAASFFLPVLNLAIYEPVIYRRWSFSYSLSFIDFTNKAIRVLMLLYIIATLCLLILKYRKINITWLKKRFKYILFEVLSLELLFFIFGFCGPMQVSDEMRLDYINIKLLDNIGIYSLIQWYFILVFAVISIIIGSNALWSYSNMERQVGKPDGFFERKFQENGIGVKIFTHGIKNQLLAQRVVIRNLSKAITEEKIDSDKLESNIKVLDDLTEQMIIRMDELYRVFKTNRLHIRPVEIKEVLQIALDKVEKRDGGIEIKLSDFRNEVVAADASHLAEAVYNIIDNSIDAICAKNEGGCGEACIGEIKIDCYRDGRFLIIEIKDNGIGIDSKNTRRIFYPFYTRKNTNYNWGLGLSFLQQIIKGHSGMVRVKSKFGEGTAFYLFIPLHKYK